MKHGLKVFPLTNHVSCKGFLLYLIKSLSDMDIKLRYISLLPSSALKSVASSAYSRLLPTGIP